MKQHEEVKAFKNELMNYHAYKHRVTKLNELIEYCYHMLGGIKGVDTSKEPSQSHVHNLDVEYKIRDEIELHSKKIERTQIKINDIESVLKKIGELEGEWVAEATFKMYADGVSSRKLGSKYGYAPSSILYIINKGIRKALDV